MTHAQVISQSGNTCTSTLTLAHLRDCDIDIVYCRFWRLMLIFLHFINHILLGIVFSLQFSFYCWERTKRLHFQYFLFLLYCFWQNHYHFKLADLELSFSNDTGNYAMHHSGHDGKHKIRDIMLTKGWTRLYMSLKRPNRFE